MSLTTLSPVKRATLRTREAAAYLGVSASWLQKLRLRGKDDPGLPGPAFSTLSKTLVLYRIEDLDAWVESRKGILLTRGAA